MFTSSFKKSSFSTAALTLYLGLSLTASATTVEFVISQGTTQGTIEVNLFDQTTPKTVTNFLNYLNEGYYNNSVFHRVVPNFIIQGGGFDFSGALPLTRKTPNTAVTNEPIYSNVKGTIAMAKLSNSPNSATDQWFFNLADNSNNLDVQNGGFTVFGQVIKGMDIIEKIAQLPLCNAGSLEGIPVVIGAGQQCGDLIAPEPANFVVLEQIVILDSSEVTDAGLNPVKNTLMTSPVTPTSSSSNDSGGGSFTWLSLTALLLLTLAKKLLKR